MASNTNRNPFKNANPKPQYPVSKRPTNSISGTMKFNPKAKLDTSQVTDLRKPTLKFPGQAWRANDVRAKILARHPQPRTTAKQTSKLSSRSSPRKSSR